MAGFFIPAAYTLKEPTRDWQSHHLKIAPRFFDDVLSKRKTFEFRKNDRDYLVNDRLALQQWTPEKGFHGYIVEVSVVYILSHDELEAIPEGWVIMGIA